MARYFNLHPENPQKRIINQAVEAIQAGEIIAYPSDSSYALGCALGNRMGVEKIRRLRQLTEKHPLTLMCSDIAQAAVYAFISDSNYKIIKKWTPGPYTFLLPATKNSSKIIQGQKRKEVGIRIPNHAIILELVKELNEPILSATLWLPGEDQPIKEADSIIKATNNIVDLVLDGGVGQALDTTIIDLLEVPPKIVRRGAGDLQESDLL